MVRQIKDRIINKFIAAVIMLFIEGIPLRLSANTCFAVQTILSQQRF